MIKLKLTDPDRYFVYIKNVPGFIGNKNYVILAKCEYEPYLNDGWLLNRKMRQWIKKNLQDEVKAIRMPDLSRSRHNYYDVFLVFENAADAILFKMVWL